MAIPTAQLTLEVIRLDNVPAALALPAGHIRYARAKVILPGNVILETGRSRPIPDTGGAFSLLPERWTFDVPINAGQAPTVTVELLIDKGDVGPESTTTLFGQVLDPWLPQVHTFGRSITFDLRVGRTLIKGTPPAPLARAGTKPAPSGTVTVPKAIVIEITDVSGLFKPLAAAVPGARAAQRVPGYVSDDNLGRVYTNRQPNDKWKNDEQFIDLTAKVTALGGATIPSGSRVLWKVIDVDDPTNDDRNFHREWGPMIDANDYDSSNRSVGAVGNDDASAASPGNTSLSLLFGAANSAPDKRWQATPGGPAVSTTGRDDAKSAINLVRSALGETSVRMHCTNVLGTNFVVKAELEFPPAGVTVIGASTGTITMWSRIDVDVARMESALSLSDTLPLIPPFFVPACVQLDFQLERVVRGAALDKPVMATTETLLSAASTAWTDQRQVFRHRGEPGWFFLGGASLSTPLASRTKLPPLHNGIVYTLGATATTATVSVPGSFANTAAVEFDFVVGGVPTNALFEVGSPAPTVTGGVTTITLDELDVTPRFTGHDSDGSISHAVQSKIRFFPQHQADRANVSTPGGIGVPSTGATIQLRASASSVSGISPAVTAGRAGPGVPKGTGRFFAGRTILFTHHPKFSSAALPVTKLAEFTQEVISTVVHEFIHSFGMPHKCGNFNWRTPRTKTCCMNYFNTWMLDTSLKPVPGTAGKVGNDMCGRHLMEIRRVHLDRNLGLNW